MGLRADGERLHRASRVRGALGRDLIGRMEAKGMIVDIAHCSHACVADILKMARRPVVSSHGGVQATCKVNRNLTDDEIRGVAATGGVIGQMASPQNLGIAAASVKQDARESTLFRKTLPCSLGRLVLLGALGFLQSTVLSFMVPRHPGSSVRPAGGSPLAMMTPAASMMLRL